MEDGFSQWWSVMTTMEQVYWAIALPSSLIFLFFIVTTFIGGDVDSDTDVDGDGDGHSDGDGIPFQFLTIKNLVGFFTIFAWTGLACINSGYSVGTTIISSTAAGLIMMFAMATVFYLMSKLTESGNIDFKKAKGSIGEVYLTIKANRKGMGKVQLKIQGTFQTLDAITDAEEDLMTGTLVDVLDVTNNNILIVKLSTK